MQNAEQFILKKLEERTQSGLIRKLSYFENLIDFCSNDYLGLASSPQLSLLIKEEVATFKKLQHGATGSRLITGNHPYIIQTEKKIAQFHRAPSALFFNSGYDANIGLLSSIPQRGDTIILDELIHASLIDGSRLSHAERYKFKHNDLYDLEAKMKLAKGICYVVVESVYSMDGDIAPLQPIVELCKKYQANLIVDEAHTTGVFGAKGEGLVCELGLEKDVFARIITFGKAIGVHGAAILGADHLRQYLINFARSFIYTTAQPLHQTISVSCAYNLLQKGDLTAAIHQKIKLYNNLIKEVKLETKHSESAIQTILFNSNQLAKAAEKYLLENGFHVKAILSPTVTKGTERLRICLHNFNTDTEILDLIKQLKSLSIN